MRTITYTVIDYNELDTLAQKVKPGFEFVADHYNVSNDSNYTFEVNERDIENFKNSGGLETGWITVADVLTALVIAGDIPKGKIMVEVSW